MSRLLVFIFTLSGMLLYGPAQAETLSLAVVYPDIREPYRGVFQEIVRGMEEELGHAVTLYPLNDQQNAATVIARSKADGIDMVVTLGRVGYAVAKPLSLVLPVVVGAVLLPPGPNSAGLSGISLTPDPEILFARLRELVPKTKGVSVIYDPHRESGEIVRARSVAAEIGMTMHALPASDLRLSAIMYQKVVRQIKDDSVAIWLPRNNAALDEQALLPMVLREAWDRRFVVFSSNLDHVRKGALFALYPNNFGMGRSLAVMARNRVLGLSAPSATIEPLRDLLLAVNIRTAEHLGLHFSHEVARTFGVTFPQRP